MARFLRAFALRSFEHKVYELTVSSPELGVGTPGCEGQALRYTFQRSLRLFLST
jgi:hypothetical protein